MDTARLNLRLDARVKALIERAAALQGQTTSAFVAGALAREAAHVIEQHESITLSVRDAERFARLLEHPPPAAEAMLRAEARARTLFGAG